MTTLSHLHLGARVLLARPPRHPAAGGRCAVDDRGEGVISAAIAVLIMAFIGALMWVGFRTIWEDAEDNTADCVEAIGSDSGDCGAGAG